MLWRNYGRSRSLWREMERLRQELDRVFEENRVATAPTFPPLNVWTSAEGVVVTAELPGVDPDGVDIAIVDKTLTLQGEREPESLEGGRYHRRERGMGKFSRSIELPFRVEADAVEAMFDKGVLMVSLPRAEADRPRKIKITTA